VADDGDDAGALDFGKKKKKKISFKEPETEEAPADGAAPTEEAPAEDVDEDLNLVRQMRAAAD
jgi:hypothetical protein